MSDAAAGAAPTRPDAQSLPARLAALRAAGAGRLDPLRFHALEALAQRIEGQPPAVQLLLQDKLEAGIEACAARLAQAQPAVRAAPARRGAATPTLIAQLTATLQGAAPSAAPAAPGAPAGPRELASVQRFRESWNAGRIAEQVERAAARKPAHAGPLNSHVLVLQALALMQDLSPDYLRHFIVHVESLQWLEQAAVKAPVKKGAPKPARSRAARK